MEAKVEHDWSEYAGTFAQDGVVCIRNLLESMWIELLREEVEKIIHSPSKHSNTREGSNYIVEPGIWRRSEQFKRVLFESYLAEAAARIMGSSQARLYNDAMFIKEPNSSMELTPWHQDLPYFMADGPYNCSAWAGLDYADRDSGAMSYVLGSHRWGKIYSPVDFQNMTNLNLSDEFEVLKPDIDADPERYRTITFELEPGDVVFHHLLTLHKAGGNTHANRRRRVYAVRFVGENSVWKQRAFSSFEFDEKLEDGAPMEGINFPVLAELPETVTAIDR